MYSCKLKHPAGEASHWVPDATRRMRRLLQLLSVVLHMAVGLEESLGQELGLQSWQRIKCDGEDATYAREHYELCCGNGHFRWRRGVCQVAAPVQVSCHDERTQDFCSHQREWFPDSIDAVLSRLCLSGRGRAHNDLPEVATHEREPTLHGMRAPRR